ncbi:MAG: NAD-binding protein [Lautropia sp.]
MTWITVGAAVTAVVLGFIGFNRLHLGHAEGMWAENPVGRFFDHLYFSLSMLTLMARQTYGEPFLMAGRWFGVVFFFSAVIRVLLPQTLKALNQWQIRRMSGHTVVFGVGSRGRAFLQDLARQGPVVGFDRRPHEELGLGDLVAELPIRLLCGDATVRLDLERTNVRRARRVIVCIGGDAVNHAVAREVLALLRTRGRSRALHDTPLDIIVPCVDQSFAQDLIGELDGAPLANVRPFNLQANAARTLLLHHPWLLAGERLFESPRHWLFVGWDDYADALLVASQTLGAGLDGGAPSVTAFVTDPDAIRGLLAAKYPQAQPQLQRLSFGRLNPLGTVAAGDFDEANRRAPIGAIFVFGRDDSAAFTAARRMRRLGSERGGLNLPVFVRMNDASAFDSGLKPLAAIHALSRTVEPFGGLAEACSESALHDWEEMLARDVHDGYREHLAARDRDRDGASRRSGRSWAEVGEILRDSNRRAIDHLPVKLARLGLIVRGALPLPRFAVPLRDATETRIMQIEHASWIAERRFAGRAAGGGSGNDIVAGSASDGGGSTSDGGDAAGDLAGGAAAGSGVGALPVRHYEPFRKLFERPYVPSDPWLRGWIATRHRAGDGAWRERILTVAALPSLGDVAARTLDARLRSFLGEQVLDQRLGNDGQEYWTLVTPLDSRHDIQLIRSLLRVLGSTAAGTPRSQRYRVVVVRPVRADADTGPDRSGLDAIAVFGARTPIDYLLELPASPPRPDGSGSAAGATAAMLAYMAGRSDETLVFGTASDRPDALVDADAPSNAEMPAAASASDAVDATHDGRWVPVLAPLYRSAAGRVVALDGGQR